MARTTSSGSTCSSGDMSWAVVCETESSLHRNPFVTSFEREIETTPISFIANIGGKLDNTLLKLDNIPDLGLMGLCMGFSFVSLAEIIYYVVLAVWGSWKQRAKVGKGEF